MPSSSLEQNAGKFRVYCVCGGFGFPFGTASTKRIRLIGRCLASTGIPFHVLHIGPSAFSENTLRKGAVDNLTFEYLSPSIQRPENIFLRSLYYIWGGLLLPFRLFQCRRNSVVYIYYQGNLINLWTLVLCRILKISAVQEACEWWPGTVQGTCFNEWMYRSVMFNWSSGALPISHEIQNRIRNLAGLEYPLCRIPVLIDSDEIKALLPADRSNFYTSHAKLLWCGMVDGYKRDVFFLIDAMAELTSSLGQNSLLYIVGPCNIKTRDQLLSYAGSKSICEDRINILGFVSDEQLWNYCIEADALLMPLWDDDRSCTRFPTKLGQYLASGRPIVTAEVGEVAYFLSKETAMFYIPGDAVDLARSLDQLLTDPALGQQLACRAAMVVLPTVAFQSNALRIGQWFCMIHSGVGHADAD